MQYPDWFSVQRAAFWIGSGGIVAHATEGVWGLACDPLNADAVDRLLEIKNRNQDQGLILIGADAEMFASQLALLTEETRHCIEKSWPGAHTWIVPDNMYPSAISGGRDRIAVRVPGHEQARNLCAQVGHPIVSTSANISGRAPAQTVLRARMIFGDRVDYYLSGELGHSGTSGRTSEKPIGVASRISDARSFKVVRGTSGD